MMISLSRMMKQKYRDGTPHLMMLCAGDVVRWRCCALEMLCGGVVRWCCALGFMCDEKYKKSEGGMGGLYNPDDVRVAHGVFC